MVWKQWANESNAVFGNVRFTTATTLTLTYRSEFQLKLSDQPQQKPNQPKMFKSHLEMIGSYEPISKKARFFNTYLKSLKGK